MTDRLAERQGSNPGSIPGESIEPTVLSIVNPKNSTLNIRDVLYHTQVVYRGDRSDATGAAEDHSIATTNATREEVN